MSLWLQAATEALANAKYEQFRKRILPGAPIPLPDCLVRELEFAERRCRDKSKDRLFPIRAEKRTGVILKALKPSSGAGPDGGGWIRLMPQENDSRPLFFARPDLPTWIEWMQVSAWDPGRKGPPAFPGWQNIGALLACRRRMGSTRLGLALPHTRLGLHICDLSGNQT